MDAKRDEMASGSPAHAGSGAEREARPGVGLPAQAAPAGTAAPEFWGVVKRLGPVGPLAVIAGTLPALGGFLLLGTMAWTGQWLRDQELLGIAIYVAVFAVTSGLALLPTYAQAVMGGWVFGAMAGGGLALAGIAGGAMIGYLIARRASGGRVVQLIDEQPKWKAVYDALIGGSALKTLGIVTLLRVPPNSPFAITNLVLAATGVRTGIYALGTVVGIAPRTMAAAVIGAGLAELDFKSARQTWLVIAGLVTLLIVVGIIGTVANRAIQQVTGMNDGANADAAGADDADRPANHA